MSTVEKPLVWICTPLRHFDHNGALTSEAFESLADHYKNPIKEFCSHPDLPWRIEVNISGGGGVFRARNRFVSEFMERGGSPDDRILMVDYDLMPTAHDYANILMRDLPIVGGLYTVRKETGHWVLNWWGGATETETGLLQVLELGTGFKCFKRSVFQTVLDKNPWLNCDCETDLKKRELCFFSAGPVWDQKIWPGRGRCLTEDYWFDWLCRSEGIPTFADTRVKLRHYDEDKKTIFPAVFPVVLGCA